MKKVVRMYKVRYKIRLPRTYYKPYSYKVITELFEIPKNPLDGCADHSLLCKVIQEKIKTTYPGARLLYHGVINSGTPGEMVEIEY